MIPYGKQSISEDDVASVVSALRSDWLTTGPIVERFESELETQIGAPCVTVSSGTAALHCAYAAIELQKGDEIITPPITFIATQAAAAAFGATIVFADVQADTANIDPIAVEACITPRTKAIVAVDFAGHPADLEELRKIASRNGIFLIEDAAHSLGSSYKNRPIGSIADLTTFSFFPTKNITTGEGGAVASIHSDLLLKARRFSRQGLIRNPEEFQIKDEGIWHQEVQRFGLNYRIPDVLCALGVSQLKRLTEFKSKRSKIFHRYNESLSNLQRVKLPRQRNYVDPMWHLYSIQVDPSSRRWIFDQLRFAGIGVQVNYLPAHWHPVFSTKVQDDISLPNAENYYKGQISLPMYYDLSEQQQQYVIDILGKIINELE